MSEATREQVIEAARKAWPEADEIWLRGDFNETLRKKAGKWNHNCGGYCSLSVRRWGRKKSYPDVLFEMNFATLTELLAKIPPAPTN